MNILVFSWRGPKHPKAGGAEQVMLEHFKGWIKAGHKVTHFSSKMPGLPNKEILDGIEIIRGGYQYLGVVIAGFFYYLKNRQRFDLVVDEFHGVPFFTPLYVKKPKIAVIQEVARSVWFLNPLSWPLNWIVGLIGFFGEPLVFLFYRDVPFMTGSLSAKKDLIKMGISSKSITVVQHGVITREKAKSEKWEKAKEKTVVFLGVLSKDKGIEEAIRCFAILHQRNPTWNFWIVGRSETPQYGEKMAELVSKLGLSKKTKFWGYVSQEQKFELLSKAHVLVNPSVHEGWGLVNIEANGMGTPVVAYKSPGLVDSVKDGKSGVICLENTLESLAAQVLKIMDDKSFYDSLCKGALEWSSNFDWKKSSALSVSLIKKLAEDRT